MQNFEEYLTEKKIDNQQFKQQEPQLFAEWQTIFEQVNPESFTAQKKFLLNPIRRRFTLKKTE